MTTTEQKFKPIIFSTEMVQAILSGRKTQTRRVIKPAPIENDKYEFINRPLYKKSPYWAMTIKSGQSHLEHPLNGVFKCPYGIVGDVLWVRETFQYSDDVDFPYLYKEEEIEEWKPEYFAKMKWKPSIYMPKDACRIFLEITDVRIERLQDITEADAIAEGIDIMYGSEFRNYLSKNNSTFISARASFFSLWESINGVGSVAPNPYVWVISFKRIDKPESFI